MTVSTIEQPLYLSREDAATMLGVTAHWLANTGRSIGVPSYRFGGAIRYAKAELLQWAEQQKVAA